MPDITSVGSARSRETVGTGTLANTLHYLDNSRVIKGTLNLLAGVTESTATAMTETTHYTVDYNLGNITLTASGTATLGTATLYADYSHLGQVGLTDTQLQESLNRAENDVDTSTNNHFVNDTETTPAWNIETNEEQRGKGQYDRDYYTKHIPIASVSTTVMGTAVTAADTTIFVNSTNGFPSSGVISIESDKINYSGKIGSAFTGCSGVLAHGTATTVFPYVVEISTTSEGTEPSYQVLEKHVDYDIDLKTGRVHLYRDDYGSSSVLDHTMPPRRVPNRFRITYPWGTSPIPDEIIRMTLMLASKDLMHMAVRKAIMDGNNDFKPTMVDADDAWIEKIKNKYMNYGISNT